MNEIIVCPKCKTEHNDDLTVMNGVDEVLQIPSFLTRTKQQSNSHIMECANPECLVYFDVDSSEALTEDEKQEVNNLWDQLEDKY